MLEDPIFPLETQRGETTGTLPDLIAGLCDGSLLGIGGLAAHQGHPFELFLMQTAALTFVAAGDAGAAEDEAAWRALADPAAWRARLAALTPGCADTAWSLVVDDLTCPAFLQPPIPAGSLAGYAVAGRTPDEIDVLVTAKAHDVKPARAVAAAPHQWAYALVSLQTQQGYSGRGNFGVTRMNGGFGSRPLVAVTPGRSLAVRFRRGVQAALTARAAALDRVDRAFAPGGIGLLWTLPWDAEDGVALDRLDPLFVEVCRRVRLVRGTGEVVAWGRPSEAARVRAPKEMKGALGDAWTPINRKETSALTVGPGGFDYRLVSRLLARQELIPSAAMEVRGNDPPEDTWLRMAVLVRGQGKTEGLHERWERIPPLAVGDKHRLDTVSKAMIDDVSKAKGALGLALRLFAQGGPERPKPDDDRARPFLDAFEQRVDAMFLPHLFARLAVGDEDDGPAQDWTRDLVTTVRRTFEDGMRGLSPADSRRERATAAAERAFYGMLAKADLTTRREDADA